MILKICLSPLGDLKVRQKNICGSFLSAEVSVNVEDRKPEKHAKPIYLKDYERERLLEKGR
jgi:hypothetical protein